MFRDKDSPLFTMPPHLFKCDLKGLKNTERMRREKLLDFGDAIEFTADKDHKIIDYEKVKD